MDVTIRAESGHGGGTAFRLTLPPPHITTNGHPRIGSSTPSELPTRPLR
jgi:hypothetical protein